MTHKKPRAGKALDFVFPILFTLAVFFGLQAYLNAGVARIELGMITLLKMTLICSVLYSMVIRPILRALFPNAWTVAS